MPASITTRLPDRPTASGCTDTTGSPWPGWQRIRVWGVIALPLRSLLYVREVDVPKLAEKYGWEFRTKHQLGVELLTWFMQSIRALGVKAKVWLAVDGAYAARPFLLPVLGLDIVVVSRLRKDACLFDLPPAGSHGNRIYGKNKISLAKRAAHRQGWETITYHCRGVEVTRQYKTFLATSELVSGQIRVVILRFEDGSWAPYFCTDTSAEVRDILEAVAARWAIEEHFHDVKEVWGAGQQQVRNVWSNIGCWHLNQWLYTLVELCCWDVPQVGVERPPSASVGQPRSSSLARRSPPLDFAGNAGKTISRRSAPHARQAQIPDTLRGPVCPRHLIA